MQESKIDKWPGYRAEAFELLSVTTIHDECYEMKNEVYFLSFNNIRQ